MVIENTESVRMAIGRAEMNFRKMILSFSFLYLELFSNPMEKGILK